MTEPTPDLMAAIKANIAAAPPHGMEVPQTADQAPSASSGTLPEPDPTPASAPAPQSRGAAEAVEVPAEEEARVPYHRLEEVVQGRRAVEAERDELKSELEQLKREKSERERDQRIADALAADQDSLAELPEHERIARLVAKAIAVGAEGAGPAPSRDPEVEALLRERQLARELPDLTQPQVEAVREVAEAHPTLSAADALALAASRSSDLFGGAASSVARVPPSHSVARPTKSAPAKKRDAAADAVNAMRAAAAQGDRRRMDQAGTAMVKALFLSGGEP